MKKIYTIGLFAFTSISGFMHDMHFNAYADDIVTLPPITVSASKGTKLEDMDVSTTTITREQVQRAPETSVDQIVNKIPGVFIPQQASSQLHPTGGTFNIRGFGTTTNVNTLVMVDGIPVNDPYFRTVDWTKIPKNSIERIEVIRGGGASSLWGNLAMGGIVNIITREPEAGEKQVDVSYGSFNTKTIDASATAFANEKIKIGVGIDEMQSNGYNKTPKQYRNPNMTSTSNKVDNVPVSVYFIPSENSKYYVKLLAHSIMEEGLVWEDTKNSWNSYSISGGGTTKLENGGSVNMNGWYDDGEMNTQNVSLQNGGTAYSFNIFNPSVGTPYVAQTESVQYQSTGALLFYSRDFQKFKDVKFGADGRDITSKDPLNIFGPSGTQTAAIKAEGEHRFQGVFGQGTFQPDNIPMDITLGLRQDFWQPVNGSLTGVVNGSPLNNQLNDNAYTHFDPRIGAKYYFDNGMDVRTAVYENFAAPGMNQMYRSFISGSNYTATSPNLEPQTNFGQEIGMDYKQSWGDVSFTLFNNKLKGFIDYAGLCTTVSTCNPLIASTGLAAGSISRVNQYVNAGDAIFRGVEFLGNWNATSTLTFNGGITATDAHLTRSDYGVADPTGLQIGQVPKYMAVVGSTWKPVKKLELTLQLKSFPSYWNNTAHTQKNDAATLADLGASYKISSDIELYALAQNIGNFKYYDQGYGYTTTNGSTISSSTIPALGMPFTATVGLRIKF